MRRRLFAVLRAAIIAPLFLSIWTYLVPRWFGGPHAFDDPRPLGWIVVALGAVVGIPCVWQFAWRGLGTPAPFDPPRRLVVTGLYRFVRNPMYVGMGILLIGEAWLTGRIEFIYETLIAFVLVSIFILAYEEPTLRAKFGEDYRDYCRNVRRWIPRLTPWYAPPHLE